MFNVFRARGSTMGAIDWASKVENRMGAFVWNDTDALTLFNAGLPVYYVQDYNKFNRQVIRATVAVSSPRVCMTAASPPYPILLSSCQAGSDEKFAAIRAAAVLCFDIQSPFENMHLPGAYPSSFSPPGPSSSRIISPATSAPSTSNVGPIRTASSFSGSVPYQKKDYVSRHHPRPDKKSDPLSKQFTSRFQDLATHSFLPRVLLPWADLNATIDPHHSALRFDHAKPPKNHTVVPNPALFFGSPDERKRMEYLRQWSHIQGSWLSSCQDPNAIPVAISSTVWKKVISFTTTGPWKYKKSAKTSQERDHQDATELLNRIFSQYNPDTPVTSLLGPVSETEGRRLLHELSWINFRYQITRLDELADQTVPQPSPSISEAEWKVRVADHR
ncbi:hypothetical protein V5O48_013155 [Marasmius crinis-equi]|uniref:Uncharacterized protein n=1 Tax=Marasmius crinis-equi TaxID=585013 RepID=A0ABR3F102_9AGAR